MEWGDSIVIGYTQYLRIYRKAVEACFKVSARYTK
jgi:hypothetical protein